MSNERVSRISSTHSARPVNRNTTTVPCDRSEVISWDTGEVLRSFPRPHEYFFLVSLSLSLVTDESRLECRATWMSSSPSAEEFRRTRPLSRGEGRKLIRWREKHHFRRGVVRGRGGNAWNKMEGETGGDASLEERVAYPNREWPTGNVVEACLNFKSDLPVSTKRGWTAWNSRVICRDEDFNHLRWQP